MIGGEVRGVEMREGGRGCEGAGRERRVKNNYRQQINIIRG